MPHYSIDRMSKDELQLAIDWAAKEGWNPGLHDLECFYAADPNGFFIAKLDEEPIAVASGVIYDDHFAFCGFYIVKPEYRGQGYGMQITQARLDYIGDRCTGIDGVEEMVDKYKNIGYQTTYKNARYILKDAQRFTLDKNIVPLAEVSVDQLNSYDRCYFPAPRKEFLQQWITQPDAIALAYVVNGELTGYSVARKCREGFKIGPLFAETITIADALLQAMFTKTQTPTFLDIPKINQHAVQLVEKYNMQEVFRTERMYRNGKPEINMSNVYGITTFELG